MTTETKIDFQTFQTDINQWFAQHATEKGLTFFLAHADDGVMWGRLDETGKLRLSGDAFPDKVKVELRPQTLQQARLFGEGGELFVWRDGDGQWNGRYLSDVGFVKEDILNETHLLWGKASHLPGPQDGFTLMRDGSQGLLHAVPIELARNKTAVLHVRHYLAYDEQGQAYVAVSRLVEVKEE